MLKLKLRNSAGLNIDGPFDTFFWLAQRVICIGMASRSIKGFVDVKLLLNNIQAGEEIPILWRVYTQRKFAPAQ